MAFDSMGAPVPDPITQGAGTTPLYSNYVKISLMTFVIISIAGLLAPIFLELVSLAISPILLIAMVVLFVVLFAASYLKVRNASGVTIYAYLFIFTAPMAIDFIVGLLVPLSGISILSGFAGVFAAYWVMSGRDFLG